MLDTADKTPVVKGDTGAHNMREYKCKNQKNTRKLFHKITYKIKIIAVSTKSTSRSLSISGAGGGGRTRTVSLPTDFESASSANSNTPAYYVKKTRVII